MTSACLTHRNAMQTGDLLLCHSGQSDALPPSASWTDWLFGVFTSLIDRFTSSPYSHVAVVLRDPGNFLDGDGRPPLADGLYVWESSYEAGVPDPQDGVVGKVGVRVTPLEDFLGDFSCARSRVVHRALIGTGVAEALSEANLRAAHAVVYDKPYDLWPRDWYNAAVRRDRPHPRTTDRFWCSALVAYIYTRCGVLEASTEWTTVRPCDFALASDSQLVYCDSHLVRLADCETAVVAA
jgi:hypothetical protein